jgi:predicted ester cyclase
MGEQKRAALAALARRWVEEGWRQGDGSIVDHLHAPDFLDHDSGGRPTDNAGFREGIVRLYAAFPDFHATVRDLVIDLESVGPRPDAGAPADAAHAPCGTVAVRWTAVGTHKAPYLGLAPTGRRIVFKGIEIIRVREGLITDRWGEWDGLDLLAQLERNG